MFQIDAPPVLASVRGDRLPAMVATRERRPFALLVAEAAERGRVEAGVDRALRGPHRRAADAEGQGPPVAAAHVGELLVGELADGLTVEEELAGGALCRRHDS